MNVDSFLIQIYRIFCRIFEIIAKTGKLSRTIPSQSFAKIPPATLKVSLARFVSIAFFDESKCVPNV